MMTKLNRQAGRKTSRAQETVPFNSGLARVSIPAPPRQAAPRPRRLGRGTAPSHPWRPVDGRLRGCSERGRKDLGLFQPLERWPGNEGYWKERRQKKEVTVSSNAFHFFLTSTESKCMPSTKQCLLSDETSKKR